MERFSCQSAPAYSEQTIVFGDMRISVLSDRIIRVEKGAFTDLRTQTIYCRNFAKPQFKTSKTTDKVAVTTAKATFAIDLKTLEVEVKFVSPMKNGTTVATPSYKQNLGGTARTLDGTFGVLGSWKSKKEKKDHFCVEHMRKGIFASNGVTELDDGKSFLLAEDGSVLKRDGEGVDKYIFAFGDDYLGGLKEYFALTGYPPLLPIYALSNWWSRYHRYSADEYLALMDKFAAHDVPLSVATVDMDWHRVGSVPKDAECHSMQGRGWTGYSFEKTLFPDYKAFLKGLKDRGLAVTMNLHPRDGVRYFEDMYPEMAAACGIDPATKKTVEFDLTDRKFLNAYFDILHHPYEADGVDFWWIDWQQGTKSKMEGLDPLWLLNHYHFLDNCRGGKTGMVLSRYAGLGSHRYPLGFSGDTVVCWKSLRFQPYFTALASNAGYTWWSHDIGGHLLGHGDNELYLRWLQFGVFSPINRLHSNNKGRSKEPWLYEKVTDLAEEYMRLRHRLLPYLYTANVRTHTEGIPLISPMYYYDDDPRSSGKQYRDQYYFGEQMLVCPVTKKGRGGVTHMRVWLPKGKWTNFFTGERFEGGREYDIDCKLKDFPVFVKDGSVVPMLPKRKGNGMSFDSIEARIFEGEGAYTLYGETGSLSFEMKKTEGGYRLSVSPSEDCPVKELTLKLERGTFEEGSKQLTLTSLDANVNILCRD